MDNNLQRIQMIADKYVTYNKHIESCRISMEIINQKEETIKILRNMLSAKDDEIRKLCEEKFIIEVRKDIEIKEFREVLKEQYELIKTLLSKNG